MRGVYAVLQGESIIFVVDEDESPIAFGVRTRTYVKELKFISGLIFGLYKAGPRAIIITEKNSIRKFELLKNIYKRQNYITREIY